MMSKSTFLLTCSLMYVAFFLNIQPVNAQPFQQPSVEGAKLLEIDKLHDFMEGLAIVERGNSTAVIDTNGNFVVPFNKYRFLNHGRATGFVNGYCIVIPLESYEYGFINKKGELAIPCEFEGVTSFDEEGHAVVKKALKMYFIDGNRQMTPVPDVFTYHNDQSRPFRLPIEGGILRQVFDARSFPDNSMSTRAYPVEGLFLGCNEKGLFGYYDRKGECLIENAYIDARPFSEGLAAVAKKNEYGEVVWGFIDKTGQVAIDFKYSLQPSDFASGYAVVVPKDRSEFHYAYIDRQGEIFRKIKGDRIDDVEKVGFQGWFAFIPLPGNKTRLLDTAGNLHQIAIVSDILDKRGNPKVITGFQYIPDVWDETIKVTVQGKDGLIGMDGRFVLKPVFDELGRRDPASKFSLAKFTDKSGKTVQGYVDQQGDYKIIKAEKTGW